MPTILIAMLSMVSRFSAIGESCTVIFELV